MTKPKDLEERVRDLENEWNQIRGAARLLCVLVAVCGTAILIELQTNVRTLRRVAIKVGVEAP